MGKIGILDSLITSLTFLALGSLHALLFREITKIFRCFRRNISTVSLETFPITAHLFFTN